METFPSNTQVDWHSLISRYLNIYQRRENKCIRFHGVDYCQISPTYIRIFILKKAFTPSHGACFLLIFRSFKCEGLIFQAFTPQKAFLPISSWFPAVFPVERLLFKPFTSIHRPCEGLKNKAFTLKTPENQAKVHTMWRGECFFRGIKMVYARAREAHSQNRFGLFGRDCSALPAQSDTAWSSLHKSPTILYNSTSWRNNSWTYKKSIPTFQNNHPISLKRHEPK